MLKSTIKALLIKTIETLMSNGLTLPLFNYLFESGGEKFRSFVIRNITQRPANYSWNVKLLNGKTMKVYIDETLRSWQFAYGYKWYNIGQSKVEKLLNDYYPMGRSYVDIGANLGLRTLYAASIGRRSVLFEPNKKLNPFTRKVYADNNYTNYVIENTCLSDKEGKATFYVSNTSYTSSLNAYYANDEKYGGGTVEELTVDLITFDQYMEQHPDLNPGMIKIDAEGHDYEVLKGCLGTIQKYHPSLMVEVNKEERPEIIELLKGYGYKYYSITPYRTPCLVPPSDPIFDQCPDLIFIYDQPLVAIFEQSGI